MPTYEYACRACSHVFEIVQKMSDDPLVICPECGGALRKVFAPPAISFKGSGFYATDHREKSKTATSADSPKGEKKEGSAPKESTGPKESKEAKSEGSSSSAKKDPSS